MSKSNRECERMWESERKASARYIFIPPCAMQLYALLFGSATACSVELVHALVRSLAGCFSFIISAFLSLRVCANANVCCASPFYPIFNSNHSVCAFSRHVCMWECWKFTREREIEQIGKERMSLQQNNDNKTLTMMTMMAMMMIWGWSRSCWAHMLTSTK